MGGERVQILVDLQDLLAGVVAHAPEPGPFLG